MAGLYGQPRWLDTFLLTSCFLPSNKKHVLVPKRGKLFLSHVVRSGGGATGQTPKVGTQSDICDARYRTEHDIGTSDIGAESDIMSHVEVNFYRYSISDI